MPSKIETKIMPMTMITMSMKEMKRVIILTVMKETQKTK